MVSESESESEDEEESSSKVHGLVQKIRFGKCPQGPKGWYRSFLVNKLLNVHHGMHHPVETLDAVESKKLHK